jgi:Zn-dependent protease/predicted transcriptional regulator
MRETFRLGQIAGIRIGVNWSVLVIFALIAYGLAGQYLPAAYPGQPVAAYVVAGLAAAVVFVASLLAHEISHALVARRNGVQVEGITLWLFGGVARLSGQAPSPAAEVRLAGVGPLVSLLLGGVFIAVAAVAAAVGLSGLPLAVIGWLGVVNIALAVFNVVPAAPLDGGRLLRALVWWRTGDRCKATVYASRAGQTFGWLLVVYGIVSLFAEHSVGGLWLALIGWFLIGAATSESRQATAQAALSHIPAERVMSTPVVTVPASATVEDLLSGQLTGPEHSAFPVTDQAGCPVGLITRNQVRNVPATDRRHTTLAQAACPLEQVPSCRTAEPLSDVMERLHADTGCGDGRALVFDDGHLAGIISARDITRALQSSSGQERTMRSPF